MLTADEGQRRAEEFARLADETVNPVLIARYRHLETSWLYLFRMKLRARHTEARRKEPLSLTSP